QFAGGRVHANDVALGAHRHDELVVNCRDGAGHAVVSLDRDRVSIAPDLAPIGQREAAESVLLLVAVVVHEIDAPVEDSSPGVAFAHVNRPQLPGFRGLPGAREAYQFRADGVAVRPAKLRPRAGKSRW